MRTKLFVLSVFSMAVMFAFTTTMNAQSKVEKKTDKTEKQEVAKISKTNGPEETKTPNKLDKSNIEKAKVEKQTQIKSKTEKKVGTTTKNLKEEKTNVIRTHHKKYHNTRGTQEKQKVEKNKTKEKKQ